MNIKETARKLGCSPAAIRSRIAAGWTEEEINSTPPKSIKSSYDDLIDFLDIERTTVVYGENWFSGQKSKIFVFCTFCKNSIESTILSVRRTLKNRNIYRCSPCSSRSPEGRTQRSNQSKAVWGTQDLREKISRSSKELANSPEGRAQRSKQAKTAWENPEFREKQLLRIRKMFQSEHYKNLVSERNRLEYENDPDQYRLIKTSALHTELAREAHREALQKESYKEIHRNLATIRMQDPEMKARIARSIEEFGSRGKKSIPEQKVEEILARLSIDFIPQKAVGPYNFDLFLPKRDSYIEIQGEYWHHLPNNSARDVKKLEFLRSLYPHSKILYIWDYELLDEKRIEEKIRNFVGLSSYEILDFNLGDVSIETGDKTQSRKFLESWHYLQYGRSASVLVSGVLRGEMISCAKFSHVTREEIAHSIGRTTLEVLELDRFCIHPSRHKKNFASYFLSKATNMIFLNHNIRSIVSFADTGAGHVGSIYKACNWEEVSRVKPNYIYRSSDGWFAHKKTVFDKAKRLGLSERQYADSNNLECVYGLEKIKFVLNKK